MERFIAFERCHLNKKLGVLEKLEVLGCMPINVFHVSAFHSQIGFLSALVEDDFSDFLHMDFGIGDRSAAHGRGFPGLLKCRGITPYTVDT